MFPQAVQVWACWYIVAAWGGAYLEDNLSDVAALVEHGGQLLPLPAGRQVQHVQGVVVGGPVSIIAAHQVDLNMCGEDMAENQLCYICSELA